MASNPLIFFRLGYMEKYEGEAKIEYGGAHPEELGYGGEMWNFRVEAGRCYGYVMTGNFAGIDLSQIDRSHDWKINDELSGVDIIFFARKPQVGQVIVGWYKDATLFHKIYRERRGTALDVGWEKIDYLCEVDSENAHLISNSARDFSIPYAPVHKYGPGHSPVWYAKAQGKNRSLIASVREYIGSQSTTIIKETKRNLSLRGRGSPDKTLITRIEQAAIDIVWEHYGKAYVVETFERDNRGWDLEATPREGGEVLYLEVKGHIGNVVQFELTPNEYSKMQQHCKTYRVCVVRQALTKPDLTIFFPIEKDASWFLNAPDTGELVQLTEKVAARASTIERGIL